MPLLRESSPLAASLAPMIVRLVTATVKAERAGAFNELMRQQLPSLRRSPGLVYAKLARRMNGDAQEVMLYEEWRDTPSLYRWTGPDLTRPRLVAGAEELADSVTIVHYEALDIVPEVDP
jgi:heme-degrading monooxygenase HmoA